MTSRCRVAWPFLMVCLVSANPDTSSQAGVLPEEPALELSSAEVEKAKAVLEAQWAAARSEIQSASIKYDISSGAFINAYVADDQLVPLLKEYEILRVPRRITELVQMLNSKSAPFRKEPFRAGEIHLEGLRIKTEYKDYFSHIVDRNHHYFFDQLNREIRLYHRGQSSLAVEHPQMFRPIPQPAWLKQVSSIARYPHAGLLQLNFGPGAGFERSFHLVYEATGLPYFMRAWNLDGSGPEHDEWIFNYSTFPGEIEFPEVSLKFRYRDRKIKSFEAYFVTAAEFNLPLRPSQLRFSAAAGVHIRDERNPGSINSVVLSTPVSDVAHYVEHILDFSAPPVPVASSPVVPASTMLFSSRFRLLLWINGIVLLLVGVACWRWRSQSQSSVDCH